MNRHYPGRPNYTGPKSGIFFLVHHSHIIEYSWDILERLDYIDKHKLSGERAWRRHCIAYVRPSELPAEVVRACATLNKACATWDRAGKARSAVGKALGTVDLAFDAHARALKAHDKELTALLTKYVPDHTWDGEELVFK